VRLERAYSLVSRDAGEMLQQPASDARALPGFCNSEAYLRGAAEPRVASLADDEFFASARHGGYQSHVVPVADFVEPTQVVVAQGLFRVEETRANGLGLEMQEGFDKTGLVIGAHGPDGHLVAVLQRFLDEIGPNLRCEVNHRCRNRGPSCDRDNPRRP